MRDLRLLPDPGGIARPGFYDLTADRYHADPVVEPSLSSSLAVTLLDKSPRHAWAEHPRLGGALDSDEDEDRAPTRAMEIGSVVHSILLGRGAAVDQIDAPSYQSKAAKEARTASYAAGRQPILQRDMKKVARIVTAAHEQMEEVAGGDVARLLADGVSEAVLVWKDAAGPWCRAMLDKLVIIEREAVIVDIKTSGTSVNPAGPALGWKIADMGYETRAAFYERGLVALHPDFAGRVRFLHLWLEVEKPYSLVMSELDGASRVIGAKKVAAAIGIWRDCLQAGTDARHWPRYDAGIHRVEYPARAESEWIEREVNDPRVYAALSADPLLRGAVPRAVSHDQLESLAGG
jgi:hypothetical protein